MFFGFNSAVRGLIASQRSLYTTNHNIDNANTKGYSRQEVEQRATRPHDLPGVGFLGTGTEIYNVERVRDSFVDFKYWNETAPKGEWEVKRDQLMEIERLMGEPTDHSFRQYMDDFYGSLDEMSKNPSDISFREPVRANAQAFTKHVNETAKRLDNMKTETKYEIESKIKNINSLSEQITGLNKQIYSAEITGRPANDLRDRRELVVDEMAKMAPVKVNESNGKYRVSVGGISIVDHLHNNEMEFREIKDEENKVKGYEILWENGGEVNLRSGELKGLMDMLQGNGEGNTYRGIPYYIGQLDTFAQGFAKSFNEVHNQGYGLEKGDNAGDFFAGEADGKITAASFTLSQAILDDVKNIGAAGNPGGSAEDNTNLLKLINQRESKEFFGSEDGKVSQGTPDDFIKSILSSMAVDSLQASRVYNTQELMQKNIEGKRQSISGVSLDEEMADMVRFQHVYVASAKMISTMDMLIDVTVNRLGIVGR